MREPLHPFPFLILGFVKNKDKAQIMIAVEKCELADKLMNFIFDDGQFSDDAHRAFGEIHGDRRIFQLSVDLFHFLRLFEEMVCIAIGQISAVQIDLV